MWLKRLAIASTFIFVATLPGCVSDDQAAREPTAKSQKVVPDKSAETDPSMVRDQKDQKAVDQDEVSSKT